jgi:hypothetical protein
VSHTSKNVNLGVATFKYKIKENELRSASKSRKSDSRKKSSDRMSPQKREHRLSVNNWICNTISINHFRASSLESKPIKFTKKIKVNDDSTVDGK